LFAAVHGQVAFFPPLFVLAIGLGYLYERTGNLWATICAHSLFNAVQLLLFFQLS
jgi:membrane protease YdiL (CAAX protease family)